MATPHICTNCHTVGTGKRLIRGSFALEILLWCFFGVGIVYTLWRKSTVITVCAACWHATLIPLTSPRGQQLTTGVTTAALIALALLTTAPAFAIERCTRALIGNGPELGPTVCTEVEDSQRGTTVAVREAHEIRLPGRDTSAATPQESPPPVGGIVAVGQGGPGAQDPRTYCGENSGCQQWYVDHAYVAQNGDVRLKQPWLYRAARKGYDTRHVPNVVLHPAR